MADAPATLAGRLGGTPDHGGPSTVYRFGQWRFEGGGRLEILEPIGADGFLHRFLRERGPGIHHVTFRVPSLREACERARAHGMTSSATTTPIPPGRRRSSTPSRHSASS